MRNTFLLFYLVLCCFSSARATNYYVSSGANSPVLGINSTTGGRGLSPNLPFATIQYAADLTNPGDTVFVRSGTYIRPFSFSLGVVDITRTGTPSQWIVFRNYREEKPLITFNTYNGFRINAAVAYIEISGFRIQGNNGNVTLAAATNQPGSCALNGVGTPPPIYNGTGISADGRPSQSTGHPHHLRFVNNEVFDCGAAGITAIESDYITIENNLIYNNSWYTVYGGSGISFLASWNLDTNPGYHMIVRNNRVFGNRLFVPWYNKFSTAANKCQGITDGNGIIVDTNRELAYTGSTLIANNVIVNNGGAGVQVFKSDNVDIINNTFYQNARSPELNASRGEVFTNLSDNILVQNNILATDNLNPVSSTSRTPNLVYNYNLLFGGRPMTTPVPGTNVVRADPQFVNPTTDPFTADFRLKATSPAINVGVNNLLSATDLLGNPRVAGANPDLGAYEYDAALIIPSTTWLGGGTTDWNAASNWSAGIPTSTLDASIPAGASPYPVVATAATVRTLTIGASASLTMGGGTLEVKGDIRNSGTFNATGGTVTLNGTTAQTLGGTTQFWNLTVANSANVFQGGAVSIRRVLTPVTGTLIANGQLTLLSDAAGTALVDNSGAGSVSGSVVVQRYIDPSSNTGAGYRHYSSPVAGSTVADLTTTGFTPDVSQAATYNASATPGTTTPFPTVFAYDQSRVTLTNNYTPFDRGFVVPTALTTPLAVGRGYAVNIDAASVVDFVGTLTNGPLTLALTRNAAGSANATEAGWQLLGNPYPAPLDYSLVAASDRTGLEAAIYVNVSTSQYAGTYRSYANGIGNPVLPVGQGFFARVANGQTSASLTFRNSQRLTTANSTTFQRAAADVRPLVQLELRATTGAADAFYAYAETGATSDFDAQYDARKLPNSSGLNLASIASSGEGLSIDGRPVFTANTVLALTVGVPNAGPYTITAAAINNLPATLDALLTDALTGQTVNLRQQPAYAFSVSPAEATALISGRFNLRFAARTPLASKGALTAAAVALYPNPAYSTFTVVVPAVAGTTQLRADLLNALGQVVRHQDAALSATGARLTMEATGLAAGIYTLRLQAGATTVAKRVILQ
ncbi:choice-of-anchor Q domain-containing protein [Hymenobacter terrenus]|uniref:choice-of-anchor Q domain-containing protein n=1 Tax=Hymenobacter terrenus TaxID=1629124 RepID=UPI0009E5DD61|nr:choice-of-anchor Q domain-containing protein [Hymenobacter terrenus]